MKGFFLLLVATLAVACTASAQVIIGFGDGSQFTTNYKPGNPATTITNGVLNLTTMTNSVAASAFYNTRVNIEQFTASFTFTSSNSIWPGDGFTFTLQNDSRGTSALGRDGGELGYGGITPSAGFGVNLYPGYPLGTFLLNNGYVPIASYSDFSSAYFSSGITYSVTLTYANRQLQATITGPDLSSPYQTGYFVDLPYLVGDTMAYVGFTGGTGAAYTNITISDFAFAPVPEPSLGTLLAGLGLLGYARWRRCQRTRPRAEKV